LPHYREIHALAALHRQRGYAAHPIAVRHAAATAAATPLPHRTARASTRRVSKLVEGAQKSWRRLDGHNQLPKLVLGVTFADGIEVIAKPTDRQPTTAAA
jgi:hypothetical protein